jgi:hypothetical protein
MTFDQQEPSANNQWTKTTFFVFSGVWALATRSSTGAAARAAMAPINVRRFIHSLLLSWRFVAFPAHSSSLEHQQLSLGSDGLFADD